jgi:hypothetical protein
MTRPRASRMGMIRRSRRKSMWLPPLAAGDQPRLFRQFRGKPLGLQVVHQRFPGVGGVAQARLQDEGLGHAAALEVVHGLGGFGQPALVEGLGGLHGQPQAGLQVQFRGRALPLLRHFDAGRLGQLLHGLRKRQPLPLHEPGEGVAVLAAAETVVEAALGQHLEAGGALAVEGAEPHPGRALAPKLHRLAHQRGKVGCILDALDDFAVAHPWLQPQEWGKKRSVARLRPGRGAPGMA